MAIDRDDLVGESWQIGDLDEARRHEARIGTSVTLHVDPASGESYTREYTPDAPGAETERRLLTGGDPDAKARIPNGHLFQGRDGRQKDFIEAPDIRNIADALIAHRECFAFLEDVVIRYRWRRKAQVKAGRMTLGFCQKLGGQLRDEMGGGDFQIVINAENCRDLGLTNWQLEALVAHELTHIAPPDPDDPESEPSLVGHDVEAFASEIRDYGLWKLDLKRIAPTFVQAQLEGL